MINNIVLTGRLTKEPELKYSNGEKNMCFFTLAVNRNFKNANGEYDADFINCVVYGNSADYLVNYCPKGTLVGVVGSIRTGKNTDKMTGETKYFTNVNVNQVNKLEKTEQTYNNYGYNQTYNQTQVDKQVVNDFMNLDNTNEDDLPF